MKNPDRKQVDLLVFDLDGTLVDSAADLTDAVNYALSTLGFSLITEKKVKSYVGDGVAMLITRALGDQAERHFPRAMELFRNYYDEHLLDKTRLYPDVMDILGYFSNKKKMIVTNKTEKYTLKIVDTLQIRDYFLDVVGEDSTPFKKPDPRLLNLLMDKRGAIANRTVVIGDGPNDILLAQKAGAISCAFLNGITGREKLLPLNPDITCESLSDLKELLC